jgi:hypothetical protein
MGLEAADFEKMLDVGVFTHSVLTRITTIEGGLAVHVHLSPAP